MPGKITPVIAVPLKVFPPISVIFVFLKSITPPSFFCIIKNLLVNLGQIGSSRKKSTATNLSTMFAIFTLEPPAVGVPDA